MIRAACTQLPCFLSAALCDVPSALKSQSACCPQQMLTDNSAEEQKLYHNNLPSTAKLPPSDTMWVLAGMMLLLIHM